LLKIHEDKAPKVKFKKHKVCKPIYNTWFGKNMPKEQDVCVLLNILFLVKINQSNLNQTDTNSIAYLVDNIKNIDSYPFWLSRHYGNVPLILYHYARFMAAFPDTDLRSGKQELISIAKNQLTKESVFLNVILLEIALLKWGEKREMMEIDLEGDWQKDFYSCIGAPFAVYNFDIAQSKYLHIYWKIPIHEWAILLEYYSHFL